MIEDGLRTLLLSFDAVSAITTTIRPDRLNEDDELPAIMIELDTEEDQNDLDGLGGLVRSTIMITALANQKTVARALAEAIRVNGTNPGTGLAGYAGPAGDDDTIEGAWRESVTCGYTADEDGQDTGEYAAVSEYVVEYYQVQ